MPPISTSTGAPAALAFSDGANVLTNGIVSAAAPSPPAIDVATNQFLLSLSTLLDSQESQHGLFSLVLLFIKKPFVLLKAASLYESRPVIFNLNNRCAAGKFSTASILKWMT
jgi:hypothetical protein